MLRTITDSVAYTQALAPASRDETTGGGVYTGTYVDMSGFTHAQVLLSLGAVSTGETVDLALYQATDSSGTSAKAVSGASLTQIADTGDNLLYSITVSADQLDAANGFTYLAGRVTVAGSTAAVLSDLLYLRYGARSEPTSNGLTQDVLVVA